MRALLIYLAVVNVAALALYGVDKGRAKRHKWRIPERTLLGVAFLGGPLGASLGMAFFRHKTRKAKFHVGVALAFALWIAVLCMTQACIREWMLGLMR